MSPIRATCTGKVLYVNSHTSNFMDGSGAEESVESRDWKEFLNRLRSALNRARKGEEVDFRSLIELDIPRMLADLFQDNAPNTSLESTNDQPA